MDAQPALFIAGASERSSSGQFIDLVSPATEQKYGTVAESNTQDLDKAVASSRAAYEDWSRLAPRQRGEILRSIADNHTAHIDEIAELVTRQNGSVISRSRITNGSVTAGIYARHAALSETFQFVQRDEVSGKTTVREPVGVVGAILPWNAPQVLLANELAPALFAGCTMVLKPSPETSLDAVRFAELAVEAGLPPGVLNVVTGGRGTGAELVQHPGIDKVAFTGSTVAGRAIASACGELLKPITAELGGKSAAILLDDADLGVFASTLISTCVPNTGQACYSCTRILVPSSLYAEVVDLVSTTLSEAALGDPMDPSNSFGPLVSARQRERVEGYIASGVADGAKLVCGGGRPADLPVGYYVEPTVFADVTPEMRIFNEEIFGPVIAITSYDGDENEAIRLSNTSSYGLNGSVYTRDSARGVSVAMRLETGSVLINGGHGAPGGPIHGYKDSGFGGMPGIGAYVRTKTIT